MYSAAHLLKIEAHDKEGLIRGSRRWETLKTRVLEQREKRRKEGRKKGRKKLWKKEVVSGGSRRARPAGIGE